MKQAPSADGITRELLDKTSKAFRKMSKSNPEKELHDFRVSLRRLLSHLKAYGCILGVSPRLEKRLRELLHSTNDLRDWQVEMKRLKVPLPKPELKPRFWKRFRELEEKLERRLSRPAFILVRARKTARRLSRIRNFEDARRIHKARIAVKDLRYILEPFENSRSGVAREVARLKRLQTGLGEIHDRDVLIEVLNGEKEKIFRKLSGELGSSAATAARTMKAFRPR